MKTGEIAKLLGCTAREITLKRGSTNEVTSKLVMLLQAMEMPNTKEVELITENVQLNWKLVEEQRGEQRKKAAKRAESIRDDQ